MKSKTFTIVATLTLAIGIGANTAIFSVIDAVLLRPLPFEDPDRLVQLYESLSEINKCPFAGPNFMDWKAQNSTLSGMSLYGWPQSYNLYGEGRADSVFGLSTDTEFFSLLGVPPLLGRTWVQGEDQSGRNRVVVLSHPFWQTRFSGNPGAIGRVLELDALKYTIVGVMPPGFAFPYSNVQLWMPLDASAQELSARASHYFGGIGRMKPDVTIDGTREDLSMIAARLEKAYPDSNSNIGALVIPLREEMVGGSRKSMIMMLAAVGLVLLIACVNVANLLFAKAATRQKEMAVRSALGASRRRLLRQLLTESLLLSIFGGALGLWLGCCLVDIAPWMDTFSLPTFNAIQLNPSVLAATFGLTVLTGILFGLVPALQTVRRSPNDDLKNGAGSILCPSRRHHSLMNALVAGEIAVSLLLLIPTGLLMKDFLRVRSLDIGVRREGIWTGEIHPPDATYGTSGKRAGFAERLLVEARRIPGVQSAALTSRLPLEGGTNYFIKIRERAAESADGPLVEAHEVTPEYFRAMGIPLLRGRLLNAADIRKAAELDTFRKEAFLQTQADVPPAQRTLMIYPTVINEALARAAWPDQDPLGKLFTGGRGDANGPWRQVVGVVGDVRQHGILSNPMPEAYDPLHDSSQLFLVLHSPMPPNTIAPAVRRLLDGIDGTLALYRTRTMGEVVESKVSGQRLFGILTSGFALVAALLSAIGIYGVLSCVVTQRTREIGIRIALGADRTDVLRGLLREGTALAVSGFAIGFAGAYAVGRVMESLLYEVRPYDLSIYAMAAVVLAGMAFFAGSIPAYRAARMDPSAALRHK